MVASIPRAHTGKVIAEWTAVLIGDLLRNPSEFKGLLELCCARISSTIAWGDGKIETARETVKRSDELLEGISPESIENKLPFLEHIPSWVPGFLQPWRANEKRRATQERAFWLGQRAQCKSLMAEKQDLTSWTKSSLRDPTLNDEEAAYTVGMLSLIGGVLESAPIQGLFIAMCHFPEWQKRGQDEVDAVCGNRMPTPDDIPQLPVVRALIRELFRWRTPVPFGRAHIPSRYFHLTSLGVPHKTEQDDVYNGYFIEKGTLCFALEW
jgi:cytochrome P450